MTDIFLTMLAYVALLVAVAGFPLFAFTSALMWASAVAESITKDWARARRSAVLAILCAVLAGIAYWTGMSLSSIVSHIGVSP